MPGRRGRDRRGQVRGRRDRRVGVAACPDVRDGDRVGARRATRRTAAEHRRGPMERQRLVDGPDAPARLALADGGEGLADGRRVVAVVVVDDDPGRLALALEAPADAGERGQAGRDARPASTPSDGGGAGDRQRVGGVVPAGGRRGGS